jgi:hypothetical protein
MPEGLEVYALSYAINKLIPGYTRAVGKHLIVHGTEDWSFGLSGRVYMDEDGVLAKVNEGYIPGSVKILDNDINELGPSWCHINDVSVVIDLVERWSKSKKKLGAILLDQKEISGIGVAWGSEILHKAHLRPDLVAKSELSLPDAKGDLINAILDVRNIALNRYIEFIDKSPNIKDVINRWFLNLYEVRTMKVYKKGTPVEVAGRKWWV